MKNQIEIKYPDEVGFILERLEKNGFEAYIVGGCVRDYLRGVVPHDWDICTSAPAETVKELFADKQLVLSGLKHGTVSVVISSKMYEITEFRAGNGEKPCLFSDLSHRDFTVNAMVYGINSGITDLFGGSEDLKNGIIKCVGSASERFKEDPLRILRAIRFSAVFGFEIEKNTSSAAHGLRDLLENVAAERKTAELKGIFSAKTPSKIISEYSDVIATAFGCDEKELIRGAGFADLIADEFAYRLGAVIRDKSVLAAMKLSAADYADACAASEYIEKEPPQTLTETRYFVKNFGEKSENMLNVMGAVNDVTEAKRFLREIKERNLCCSLKELDISGGELMKLGFDGARIGRVSEYLLRRVIEGELENEKSALASAALSVEGEKP